MFGHCGCVDFSGLLGCVVLPTSKPVEIIIKNKEGKAWTLSLIKNMETGENQNITMFTGTKVTIHVHIRNGELKASPTATCIIRE